MGNGGTQRSDLAGAAALAALGGLAWWATRDRKEGTRAHKRSPARRPAGRAGGYGTTTSAPAPVSTQPTTAAGASDEFGGPTLGEAAMMFVVLGLALMPAAAAPHLLTEAGGAYTVAAGGRLFAMVPAGAAAFFGVAALAGAWRAAARRRWGSAVIAGVPGVAFCAISAALSLFAFSVAPNAAAVAAAYAADRDLTVDSVTRGSDGTTFTLDGPDGTCEVRFELRGRTLRPLGDCSGA